MRSITAAVALALVLPAAAAAATSVTQPETSSNWAGYAVAGAAGADVAFSDVTGTWTQPRVRCTVGRRDAVAFWVGIGGFADGSQSLQQLGTEASCDGSSTTPTYEVWWEIVPDVSHPVKLRLAPGDTVTAAVLVQGRTVTMSLKNLTRKTRFTRQATVAQPLDTTSAEWIVEAPAACTSSGRCRTVNLTNFGRIAFTKAAAIGDGHAGTISDGAWEATPLQLVADTGFRSRFFDADVLGPGVGAVPGDLSADGRGFSVAWQQRVAPAA